MWQHWSYCQQWLTPHNWLLPKLDMWLFHTHAQLSQWQCYHSGWSNFWPEHLFRLDWLRTLPFKIYIFFSFEKTFSIYIPSMHHIFLSVQALTTKVNPSPLSATIHTLVTLTMHTAQYGVTKTVVDLGFWKGWFHCARDRYTWRSTLKCAKCTHYRGLGASPTCKFLISDLLISFLVLFRREIAGVGRPTAKSSHCI